MSEKNGKKETTAYNLAQSLHSAGLLDDVVSYLKDEVDMLLVKPIDPVLRAEEYKIVDLGRREAVVALNRLIGPLENHHAPEQKKKIEKENLYLSHDPVVY